MKIDRELIQLAKSRTLEGIANQLQRSLTFIAQASSPIGFVDQIIRRTKIGLTSEAILPVPVCLLFKFGAAQNLP